MLQFSESATIRRHIYEDLKASLMEPHLVAFGKTLPVYLRRKPFTVDVKEKWMTPNVYHEDLATMAAVWEGITELQYVVHFILIIN